MIPSTQALWPLASAAAALAFLVSRPWRRRHGRLASGLAGALVVVDAAILFGGAPALGTVGPLAVVAALLLVALGATIGSSEAPLDSEPRVVSPQPVPRPSPCTNSELLQWAVDQASPALAVSRFDGEMVFVNAAWAKLHGLRAQEVPGHRWSLFHTPEQMETELRALMAKVEAEGAQEALVGRRRPDGATFKTWTRMTLVFDPETAAAVGWIARARPVEEASTSSEPSTAPSSTSISLVGFGRRVREAAHDFNNLLSAVVGNAGLLLEQVEDAPELRREVAEIESAAMRAAKLASALQAEAREVAPPSIDFSSGAHAALPPQVAASPEPAPAPVAEVAATGPAATADTSTVLVVDNEKIVRDLARSVLEVRGYDVLLASDGPMAVELFEMHRQTVDAVLLDFGMPGMDGRQVFDQLRQLDPGARVVLMTGFRDHDLVAAMERDGLAGSLPKPFRPAQLIAMLEQVIEA